MSTGEGIFLAGLAIAFALLLWNPETRRIVGKSFKWIIGASIVVGLGIWAYVSYENYTHHKRDAPTDNPQLAGVKLGDSRNDVIYKKGKPSRSVDGDDEYEKTVIYYDDNKVSAVFFSCKSDWTTELNGVACNDSAEKLKKRFKGKVYCLPDTPTERIFMVAEFNSIYILQQETVKALGIKSGSGKKWVDCNTVK
jgi:hypothetical protein